MNAITAQDSQIARQLRWALRDTLQPLLDLPGVTDLHVNGAGEDGNTLVFLKRHGMRETHQVYLTAAQLQHIGIHAAVLGRGQITETMPFSPGRFPDRQRVQVVRSPALPEGRFAISVRRGASLSPTPDQLDASGVFDTTVSAEVAKPRAGIAELLALKEAGKFREFLETAFAHGFNGMFGGAVNTGKTHVMRAFFHSIPKHKRIVTVQDAEELDDMPQPDVVHLLYPKDTAGGALHTSENCIEAALRMDMDEIVNGEIRDGAAWALLRAGASGHAFKSTCHAKSAAGVFDAMLLMAKQHPTARSLDTADLRQTLRELIDFVAFSEVVGGKRRVTQIWFDPEAKKGAAGNSVLHALQETP